MTARHMYIEYPAPDLGDADPCNGCDGNGVTGEMLGAPTDTTAQTILISDVFCPLCGGCGRATHTGCQDAAHGLEPVNLDAGPPVFLDALGGAVWPTVEGADFTGYLVHLGLDPDDTYDGLDDEAPEGACPSCHGREWNALPLYEDRGPAEGSVMVVVRVACGCVEARAVELELPEH